MEDSKKNNDYIYTVELINLLLSQVENAGETYHMGGEEYISLIKKINKLSQKLEEQINKKIIKIDEQLYCNYIFEYKKEEKEKLKKSFFDIKNNLKKINNESEKNYLENYVKKIGEEIFTYFLIAENKKEIFSNNKTIAIVIPAYNAEKTIKTTLYSIAKQNILQETKLKVYIVNDASKYNYKEIIKNFNLFYEIVELTLNENMGPGYARQYGIENCSEDYIIFCDSDDYFYDPSSIKLLYNSINNYDMVVSKFKVEHNSMEFIQDYNFIWLHGKIFSREFLVKNNIKFNNTRANEDVGFLALINYYNPRVNYIDDVTYVWSQNDNSITRREAGAYRYNSLKYFAYNMAWATNIALNNNLNKEKIAKTLLKSIVAMWSAYSEHQDKKDVDQILSWTKELYDMYTEKNEYKLSDEIVEEEIKTRVNIDKKNKVIIDKYINFNKFLNMVKNSKPCE